VAKVPVISLWQPHASLMAMGTKKIETRGHKMPVTLHDRVVGIHAAARRVSRIDLLADYLVRPAFFRTGIDFEALPYGAIIALTRFSDDRRIGTEFACKARPDFFMLPPEDPERSFGDYTPGRYGWITSGAYALPEPIPAKGKQGVWYFDVPDEHVRAAEQALLRGAEAARHA
jgi:hypothetical protein